MLKMIAAARESNVEFWTANVFCRVSEQHEAVLEAGVKKLGGAICHRVMNLNEQAGTTAMFLQGAGSPAAKACSTWRLSAWCPFFGLSMRTISSASEQPLLPGSERAFGC